MPFGCLICDESLEAPAPVPVLDRPGIDPAPGAKPKKTKAGQKRPPATVHDNVVTPCGHMFHELCLHQWFKSKSSTTCPLCRKTLTKAKLNRVFPSVVEEDIELTPSQTVASIASNKNPITPKIILPSGNNNISVTPVATSTSILDKHVPSQRLQPAHSSVAAQSSSNPGPLTGVIKYASNGKWSYHTPLQLQSNGVPPSTAASSMMQSNLNQFTSSSSSSIFSNPYQSVFSTGNTSAAQPTANSYFNTFPYQAQNGNGSASGSSPGPRQQAEANFPNYNPFMQSYSTYSLPRPLEPSTPALASYYPHSTAQSLSTIQQLGAVQSSGFFNKPLDLGNGTAKVLNFSTSGSGAGSVFPSSSQTFVSSATSSSVNQSTFSGNQLPLASAASGSYQAKQIPPAIVNTSGYRAPRNQIVIGQIDLGIGQRGSATATDLTNKYDEINVIHQTLVADYNELQQKYNDSQDEVQLLKAQLESFKDEIKRLQESAEGKKSSNAAMGQTSSSLSFGTGLANSGLPITQKRKHEGQQQQRMNPDPSNQFASGGNALTSTNATNSSSPALTSNPFAYFNGYNPLLAALVRRQVSPQQSQLPRQLEQRPQRPSDAQPAVALTMPHTSRPPTPALN